MSTSNGGAAAAGPVEPTDGAEVISYAAQTIARSQQGARCGQGIPTRSHTTGAAPSQARAWRGMSYLRRGDPNPSPLLRVDRLDAKSSELRCRGAISERPDGNVRALRSHGVSRNT